MTHTRLSFLKTLAAAIVVAPAAIVALGRPVYGARRVSDRHTPRHSGEMHIVQGLSEMIHYQYVDLRPLCASSLGGNWSRFECEWHDGSAHEYIAAEPLTAALDQGTMTWTPKTPYVYRRYTDPAGDTSRVVELVGYHLTMCILNTGTPQITVRYREVIPAPRPA